MKNSKNVKKEKTLVKSAEQAKIALNMLLQNSKKKSRKRDFRTSG